VAAAFRTEDPCLSVGSHSAAAFTMLFDHSGIFYFSFLSYLLILFLAINNVKNLSLTGYSR